MTDCQACRYAQEADQDPFTTCDPCGWKQENEFFCDEHEVWHDPDELCPECEKESEHE